MQRPPPTPKPPTSKVLDQSAQANMLQELSLEDLCKVILPQELSPEVLGMASPDLVLGPLPDILDTLDHLGMPELLIRHMPIHQLLQFNTEAHVNKGTRRVVPNHLKD